MARRGQRHGSIVVTATVLATLVVPVVLASVVLAHPLGNFTINHYAGLHLEPGRVLVDLVIDEAEIPAFQSIAAIDTDGDATVSGPEREAAALERCGELRDELDLRAGPDTATLAALDLRLIGTGLSFPLGSSGIETLRLVCAFESALPAPLDPARPSVVAFEDPTGADRLGWREVVVAGSGVRVEPAVDDVPVRTAGVSARLTAYPPELALQPLRDGRVVVRATADAAVATVPFAVPDVTAWLDGGPATAGGPSPAVVGRVSGGETVPSIFAAADLTPLVLVGSILTAIALGAGHALTPGHGKALMGAYLVGTRGGAAHAIGLGLAVSISHTAGILVLATIVIVAADVLPPDLVVRVAPVVAAVSILAIGAWMLAGTWRARRAHGHAHPHRHPHTHAHLHTHTRLDEPRRGTAGVPSGPGITWRSLTVLGLAGGLIPSTSALLILLGAIAAGRPAFGVVLVVAFGAGMAAVLVGLGLLLVVARDRLDRLPAAGPLTRLRLAGPLVAAAVVFGFGVLLTAQALAGLGVG